MPAATRHHAIWGQPPAVLHRNSAGDRPRLASGSRVHPLDFKQVGGDPGTFAAGGYNINVLAGKLRHGLQVARLRLVPRAPHCQNKLLPDDET